MTRVLRLLVLGAPLSFATSFVASFAACGPVTYVSRVTFGASGEVAKAKVSNGEKMAPYEYITAQAYLQKSKELAGYARFQDSNRFAQRSLDMARKAREVAGERERKDEQPIYVPDGTMYITSKGTVRLGRPNDNQSVDSERPPLDADSEKPPLGDAPGDKGGKKKGGGR